MKHVVSHNQVRDRAQLLKQRVTRKQVATIAEHFAVPAQHNILNAHSGRAHDVCLNTVVYLRFHPMAKKQTHPLTAARPSSARFNQRNSEICPMG
jgi:hypothetical protein